MPKFDLNDVKKDEDVRKEIIGYFAFMHYYPSRKPISSFSFTEKIPNPITRVQAVANKEYAVSYKRRTFQGLNMEDWRTKDLNKG